MKKAFTLIELLIVIAIIAILALIAIPNFLEAQVRAQVSRVKADMRTIATAFEAYYVDNNQYPYRDDHSSVRHPYEGYIYMARQKDTKGTLYYGDNYPVCWGLTTPIGYLTSFPTDPFRARPDDGVGVSPTVRPKFAVSYFFYNFDGLVRKIMTVAEDPAYAYWWSYGGPGLQASVRSPAPLTFNQGPDNNSRAEPVYASTWALMSPGPDLTVYVKGTGYTPGGGSSNIACGTCMIQNESGWVTWIEHGKNDFYDPTNGTTSRGDIWRLSSQAIQ